MTFILIGMFYQVETLPSYRSAAQENQSANKQTGTPAIEQPLPDRKATKSADKTEQAGEKIKKAEWVAIGINSFIALVILWQAWIYSEQRKATRVAERGYVGIATADLVDFQPGLRAHVAVRFLNGGRTPIWYFQAPATLRLGVEPPEKSDLPPRLDQQGEGFLPAGAGTTLRYKFPDETTEGRILRVANRERQIFLWGTAYFEDCWGEERSYSFKMIYNPEDAKFEEYKVNQTW